MCLLQPRCRFLINIARGSAEVHVLLFYGHMIKRSFHTCSLWKGRKVNEKKVERKINKIRCRKHSLPIAFLSCVCRGTKLAVTLIDLSHLRVFDRNGSNREDQVQGHAEWRSRMCTFLTIFLGFYFLHYLVCYNVKHHAIVVTLAVRSLPSSSVACWNFKLFVSRLLHCTHPPRASQNDKEER